MTRRSLIAGLISAPFAALMHKFKSKPTGNTIPVEWQNRGGIISNDGTVAKLHRCGFGVPGPMAKSIHDQVKKCRLYRCDVTYKTPDGMTCMERFWLPLDGNVPIGEIGDKYPSGTLVSIEWEPLQPVMPSMPAGEPRELKYPVTGGLPWKDHNGRA